VVESLKKLVERGILEPAQAASQLGQILSTSSFFQPRFPLNEKLGELAEKGAELRREGTLEGSGSDKGLKGVYGFTVRVGTGPDKGLKVQPFGNIKKNVRGESTVSDEREPMVDLFDEPECVLVIAEVPGVELPQVKVELRGDVLVLQASSRERKYHKELLLPRSFTQAQLTTSMRNGLLEVRLDKRA
jgi:HSP20 family protein